MFRQYISVISEKLIKIKK